MADINLQHILALALLHGTVSFAAVHSEETLNDSSICDLRSRIELVADPQLHDDEHPRQVILEVSTRDGKQFKKYLPTYRGTPENPPSTEEVERKARDLVIPIIGSKKGEQLIKTIEELELVNDMRQLRSTLTME